MPLIISEVNADDYDATDNSCTHLHYLGQSLEWTLYDEATAVGIGANWSGGEYGSEHFFFRRVIGYGLGVGYASGYLECYMWMEGGYNDWPYHYTNPSWTYGWIANQDPPPSGQTYYRQDYSREETYATSEIWAAAESWFFDPYETEWWDCFAYAHLEY